MNEFKINQADMDISDMQMEMVKLQKHKKGQKITPELTPMISKIYIHKKINIHIRSLTFSL